MSRSLAKDDSVKYTVMVHALPECGEAIFVGETSVSAPTAKEAKRRAIETLWDDRLTCASCRARASVIGEAPDGEEPPAVRAARSTRSLLEQSERWRFGALSEYEWRWYRFWWTWTAVRFSSARQDRAWVKLGSERFYRRIERVRAWRSSLLEGGVPRAA